MNARYVLVVVSPVEMVCYRDVSAAHSVPESTFRVRRARPILSRISTMWDWLWVGAVANQIPDIPAISRHAATWNGLLVGAGHNPVLLDNARVEAVPDVPRVEAEYREPPCRRPRKPLLPRRHRHFVESRRMVVAVVDYRLLIPGYRWLPRSRMIPPFTGQRRMVVRLPRVVPPRAQMRMEIPLPSVVPSAHTVPRYPWMAEQIEPVVVKREPDDV